MEKRRIELTHKQDEAFEYLMDDNTSELLFGGGVGGAKSFIGCLWLINNCLKYKGTRWLMGRTVLKILKQTTLNTFFDVASMLGLQADIHYMYNSQAGEIRFFNESSIILKDLEFQPKDPNYDYLGSLEITGAFIDECNQITSVCKDIVMSRIRYKLDENDLIPKILMTCNPAKNWVYRQFYKPWKNKSLPIDRKFIQALAKDNPYLSKHYIKALEKIEDEAKKQRLLYGNWEYDDDPTALYDYDKLQDLFQNEFVETGQNYISADVAMYGSDKLVLIVWNGLRAIKIITREKTDGKEIEKLLRETARRYKVPTSNIVFDADGLGAFLGGYFKSAYKFNNGAKAIGIKKGDAIAYENLKTQCYYELKKLINDDLIFINADEEDRDAILEELSAIKTRDTDKEGRLKITKKDELKRNLGRSPDYADAIMMRVIFELSKRNKPRFYDK